MNIEIRVLPKRLNDSKTCGNDMTEMLLGSLNAASIVPSDAIVANLHQPHHVLQRCSESALLADSSAHRCNLQHSVQLKELSDFLDLFRNPYILSFLKRTLVLR